MRIFTPTTEYDFAGHPTLGSARAWLAHGGTPRVPGRIVQECGAGLVTVRVDDDLLWFATPPRTGPLHDDDLAAILADSGLDASQVVAHAWASNGPEWRILQLVDADAVRAVRPSPVRRLRFGLVGMEEDGAPDLYEVRAFGASHEDPVTGSLHGSTAQWLRERGLAPDRWTAGQGSQLGRRGRVHLHDDGIQLWVGGRATVTVTGELHLSW